MSVSGEKLFGVFNAGWANQAGQHLIDVMKKNPNYDTKIITAIITEMSNITIPKI